METTALKRSISLTRTILRIQREFDVKLPTDLVQTLVESTNREIREHNAEQARKAAKIINGTDFEVIVRYHEIPGVDRMKVDIIPLEGFTNAIRVFQEYHSKAFSLELMYLELSFEGKRVKRINFKYGRA